MRRKATIIQSIQKQIFETLLPQEMIKITEKEYKEFIKNRDFVVIENVKIF
ncbi:MAG: hypothetical protein ABDH49_01170 [Candidatus Hydrothermales bacterium]